MGAEIYGLALFELVDSDNLTRIKNALSRYQVLLSKEQKEITPAKHIELAKKFGILHAHTAAPTMKYHPQVFEIHVTKESKITNGEFWHSDVSYDEKPPLGTMLQLNVFPKCGSDTMFSNFYSAYNSLSNIFKSILGNLKAIHESAHIYKGRYNDMAKKDKNMSCRKAIHPIARTHTDSKKKALFVNRTFNTKNN